MAKIAVDRGLGWMVCMSVFTCIFDLSLYAHVVRVESTERHYSAWLFQRRCEMPRLRLACVGGLCQTNFERPLSVVDDLVTVRREAKQLTKLLKAVYIEYPTEHRCITQTERI